MTAGTYDFAVLRQAFGLTAKLSDGNTIGYTDLAMWQVTGPLEVNSGVNGGVVRAFAPTPNGLVTASSLATPQCPAVSTTATIVVNDAILTSMTLTPASANVTIGGTADLDAAGHYSDGTTWDLTTLATWSSSKNAVATVTQDGLVKGKQAGHVIILATVGTVSGTAHIGVGGLDLVAIIVKPDAVFACGNFDGHGYAAGVRVPMMATAKYSDGSTQVLTSGVLWSSAKPGFATVNGEGLVETVAAGTATLSAKVGGITGTFDLKVVASTLKSIEIVPGSGFTLPIFASQRFGATGTYQATIGGVVRTDLCDITGLVSWQALPSPSLGIDALGLVTTKGVVTQSATITATRAAVVATVTGRVTGSCVKALRLEPTAVNTTVGISKQLVARQVLSDGSLIPATALVWSTSNPAVATVSGGVVSPVAAGQADVFAQRDAGGAACPDVAPVMTAASHFTVSNAQLMSLLVTCERADDLWPLPGGELPGLPVGVMTQCTAFGFYSDGSNQNVTNSVEWLSGDPNVASASNAVGSKGRLLTLGLGVANLQVNLGGVVGALPIRVVGATLNNVVVTGPLFMPIGFTEAFTAEGFWRLGTRTHSYGLTGLATWQSNALAVAIVSDTDKGLVTALTPGFARIAAAYQGVSGDRLLGVYNVTLNAITVAPDDSVLSRGLERSFTATGLYVGPFGVTLSKDVTNRVAWFTSDANVASVTAQGRVHAHALGFVAITAELDAASGSAELQVVERCIAQLDLQANPGSVPAGVPLWVNVLGTFSDGSTQDLTGDVSFTSGDPSKMPAPNAAGYTFARQNAAAGQVVLTALAPLGVCPGASGLDDVTVTIRNTALASIDVIGDSVPVGLEVPFFAVGHYADGSSYDLTRTIDTWDTGSAAIATVQSGGAHRGRVTGVAVGTTPIVATQGVISGVGQVSVVSATLTSLTVQALDTRNACRSPSEAEDWIGTGFEHPRGGFTAWVKAIGHYSDGIDRELTDSVAWTSSDETVARVSNVEPGRVTTANAGTALLRASAGIGLTATVAVLVVNADADQL